MADHQHLLRHFKSGDILAYRNHPDNAPHHTTVFGKVIELVQSAFWWWSGNVDTHVTHFSLIEKFDRRRAQPGFTRLNIVDTLLDKKVEKRFLEHNYDFMVFRLRRDQFIHQEFTVQELVDQAMMIARHLIGVPYNRWTALQVFTDWSNREGKKLDEQYTAELIERFQIDLSNRTFSIDKDEERMICPEVVLGSYQIAWLLLAGESARNQPLPDWLNFHMHCSPAGLANFLTHNTHFQKIASEHIEALRYSGAPDPRDEASPRYVQNMMRLSQNEGRATPPFPQQPVYQHDSSSGPVGLKQH
jgi:hypothetical protein